ncbi:MAG: zf-HC2 domain-containing protein [Acidobacteriia bacterium]|nr:zf-HC2 domain-containing protein [Terriglobia bacterium]
MKLDPCPLDPKHAARAYLSGALTREEAAEFEQHFIGCPRCGDQFQFTTQFVTAVQRVAQRMGTVVAETRPRVVNPKLEFCAARSSE